MMKKKQPTPPKGFKPKKGYTTKDSIEYERMVDRQDALLKTITPDNYQYVNALAANRADSMGKNAYGSRFKQPVKATSAKPVLKASSKPMPKKKGK